MDPAEFVTSPVEFQVDPAFRSHFQNRLKQVFLYINDQCNLACEQCIYKPHVTYHVHREIPVATAIGLLQAFFGLGARKLTVLGGEPTLYGAREGHVPLRTVLRAAREIGFEYLRLDTNGHFHERVFTAGGLDELDELAFSLDGYDAPTNDLLRGSKSFYRTTERIKDAVGHGMKVSITCCIHRELVQPLPAGDYGVDRVIRLGEKLGVSVVNFHDLFKAGVPMDTWTGSFDTTVAEHVRMYSDVRNRIETGAYSVNVRLPQCFVRREEFERNPEYYGYCPVKLGERVMVHSDGIIRICSNLICTSFGVGRYDESMIRWDRSSGNETLHHDLSRYTPCTNRSKNRSYGGFVPLCFSLKPNQAEPVWRDQLKWDNRRTVDMVPTLPDPSPLTKPERRIIHLPVFSGVGANHPTTSVVGD
jgi:MoaA/NifB/PqqE/SkfB family radical SAM enzyme